MKTLVIEELELDAPLAENLQGTKSLHFYADDAGVIDRSVILDYEVPTMFVICGRCEGHGTHCNPSIDGNGISGEEFAEWDEDEREGYFAGRYDVRCEAGCDNGKASVPDFEKVPECIREAVVEYFENVERWASESKREREMGY